MDYLIYNRLADNGHAEEDAKKVFEDLKAKNWTIELVCSNDKPLTELFKTMKEEDRAILLGGDGTLNYLINHIEEIPAVPLFLLPSGTGNDFFNDVKEDNKRDDGLIALNPYLSNLPKIDVNGKTYRFINGIGFGIDGECCVKADEMKAAGAEKIDYSSITLKLLFGPFVPRIAKCKVDGVEIPELKKTYLASAMNGRYYGGGMKIAPEQKRNSGHLTLVVIHGKGKLGTFMMFPGLFKGTHVKKKKNTLVKTGKVIEVEFDTPCGLQIDGEVVKDVKSYKAYLD